VSAHLLITVSEEVSRWLRRDSMAYRREVQMVFQDPYQTLNPRFTIGDIVAEPLKIHGLAKGRELDGRVVEALERAGLKQAETYKDRFPHEFSGGQRQRVAIARAIVLEPRFVVADEPVSMLDVSIRAGVLNLMRRFRDEMGISFVYVSHDLPTIRYVADRTAIMYLGEIVEIGPTEKIIAERNHPYTRLLLDASPEPDPDVVKPPLEAAGEIPSAIAPPNGCRFHTRCPFATPICGWEGRDVQAALAVRRLEGEDLSALGDTKIEGTDILVAAPNGADAARAAVKNVMAARKDSLLEAARISVEGNALRISFKKMDSPAMRSLASDHKVACVLFD
jgi:peptide/nickel transport system ATP-binding protein